MQKGLWICLLLWGLMACKTQQGTQISIADDFALRITRTACYGTCPDFTLLVDANGNVAYTGRNFVDNIGEYQKKLKKKTVKELASALEAADYWSFKKAYDQEGITDLPSVITEFTHNGKSHQVINRIGAPEELGVLQKRLEEIVGADGYKPVNAGADK